MTRKCVWSIAVRVPARAEEAVVELFASLFGQNAASYTNVETRLSTITAYFEEKPRISAIRRAECAAGLERIRECGLDVGRPKLSVRKLPRQDWAESWKKHFRPIEIGSALLIKPSWSKQRPKKGQATVILDPGLSFGTGQHPTTEFCLRELVRRRAVPSLRLPAGPYLHKRPSFLDIGTGSGILAIAAARLGYGPIDAFDFDPESVRVARANARQNRVLNRISFFEHDVARLSAAGAKYSVICANLISNLLIDARDRILIRLREDGIIVVAGILRNEFDDVQRAYEQAGLELIKCAVQKEWRSGSFARRN